MNRRRGRRNHHPFRVIRADVDTVTSDPAYHTNVRRLQAAIGRHHPFDEIAHAVTDVSAHL